LKLRGIGRVFVLLVHFLDLFETRWLYEILNYFKVVKTNASFIDDLYG